MHLFMIVPGTARAKLHSAGAALHRGPHGRGAPTPHPGPLAIGTAGPVLDRDRSRCCSFIPKTASAAHPAISLRAAYTSRKALEEISRNYRRTVRRPMRAAFSSSLAPQKSNARQRAFGEERRSADTRRAVPSHPPRNEHGGFISLAIPHCWRVAQRTAKRRCCGVGLSLWPDLDSRRRPWCSWPECIFLFAREIAFCFPTSECELINQNPRHFVSSSAQ